MSRESIATQQTCTQKSVQSESFDWWLRRLASDQDQVAGMMTRSNEHLRYSLRPHGCARAVRPARPAVGACAGNQDVTSRSIAYRPCRTRPVSMPRTTLELEHEAVLPCDGSGQWTASDSAPRLRQHLMRYTAQILSSARRGNQLSWKCCRLLRAAGRHINAVFMLGVHHLCTDLHARDRLYTEKVLQS